MSSSESSRPARMHGLDTLRAAAILLVMLYHLQLQGFVPAVLRPAARVGWIGVDLFFVLSGFLIGSQLLKPYVTGQRLSLKDFYLRRAYRILPAFVVVLLLYIAVPLWREAPGPYAWWQYATFTWNLLLLHYPEQRAFSHVWSLCVEEHFYLCLPPLLLLLMRRPSVWKTCFVLLLIVVGGIGLRAYVLEHVIRVQGDGRGLMMMKYVYYPTYSRLDGLAVGVALAVMRIFRPQWWNRLTRFSNVLCGLGVASVAGGLGLCAFDYPNPDLPASIMFAFPALAFGFGLLVASATCEGGILRKRVPGATALASLAFSLYLTHKSVAHAVHHVFPELTREADWRSFAIYGLACVGVGSLLYLGVERPFLRLRMRRSERQIDNEVRLDPAI